MARVPNILANGPGNVPDADDLMANFDWLTNTPASSITLAGVITVTSAGLVTIAGINTTGSVLTIDNTGNRGAGLNINSGGSNIGILGSSGMWLGSAASDLMIGLQSGKAFSIYYGGGNNKAISVASTGACGIRGTATNDDPTAGFVGEVVSSAITTYTAFGSNNQYTDLTSITPGGGDWMVGAFWVCDRNGATVSDSQLGIGTASGNSSTGLSEGDTMANVGPWPSTGHQECYTLPARRYSLSGSTTLYMKMYHSSSVATPRAKGRITAIRIR
jgi:hypothetical protein